MPAFTSFLNLYKPGGGSSGLILPDEVVDIDRINANMDVIDAFASGWGQAAARNHQFYGPAASMAAVAGMKRGDTYQESDDDFQLWTYDGANWLAPQNGMFLIRPTSAVGGTIGTDGTVTATAGDNVTVNGIFSTRFRRYKVIIEWRVTGGVNGAFLNLCQAGVPNTGTGYFNQSIVATGASLVSGYNPGATAFTAATQAGTVQRVEADFTAPGHPVETLFDNRSNNPTAGIGFITGHHASLAAFDGLKFTLSSVGGGRALTQFALTAYGLA